MAPKKAAPKAAKKAAPKATAPTKAELDKMPPGIALALADRYGVKGYERPEATLAETD